MSWTVHILDPNMRAKTMYAELEKYFGPLDNNNPKYYLGRNYSRPFSESECEITFYTKPTVEHTLFSIAHPNNLIEGK